MEAAVRTYRIKTLFDDELRFYEAPPGIRASLENHGEKFEPIRRFDVDGAVLRLRRINSAETIIPLQQVARIDSQEELVFLTA